ncbi:hypothetical protein HUJ05_006316 [Dendroctonus ponderosae]|nr:hypothetical protein HUJ05_006316 [Dendroctonus ponderosae]
MNQQIIKGEAADTIQVVADVHEQHTQEQSQKHATTRKVLSNAERQTRFRAKKGALTIPSGLAHCLKIAANSDGVCCDISNPGTRIVLDSRQPKKIFSHTICKLLLPMAESHFCTVRLHVDRQSKNSQSSSLLQLPILSKANFSLCPHFSRVSPMENSDEVNGTGSRYSTAKYGPQVPISWGKTSLSVNMVESKYSLSCNKYQRLSISCRRFIGSFST